MVEQGKPTLSNHTMSLFSEVANTEVLKNDEAEGIKRIVSHYIRSTSSIEALTWKDISIRSVSRFTLNREEMFIKLRGYWAR